VYPVPGRDRHRSSPANMTSGLCGPHRRRQSATFGTRSRTEVRQAPSPAVSSTGGADVSGRTQIGASARGSVIRRSTATPRQGGGLRELSEACPSPGRSRAVTLHAAGQLASEAPRGSMSRPKPVGVIMRSDPGAVARADLAVLARHSGQVVHAWAPRPSRRWPCQHVQAPPSRVGERGRR
jgi:hypothetical protein